jgi:hypothetical protein
MGSTVSIMTADPIPTAATYLAEAATIAAEVVLVTGMTAQQQLRGAVHAADTAYTAAVQAAVGGSGDWAAVQTAKHVFMQARNAEKEGA